jgi:3-hydroxymyristoyl/3-hydroxydecanoyl-(acyl carrier protein) dehydratase
VLGERLDGDTHVIELELPLDLACFAEHFPDAPVLPGVVQIGWALDFAAPRLGTPTTSRGIDALKFQRLLRPGDRVELTLRYDAVRERLHFAYRTGDAHYSSAHLRLEGTHA